MKNINRTLKKILSLSLSLSLVLNLVSPFLATSVRAASCNQLSGQQGPCEAAGCRWLPGAQQCRSGGNGDEKPPALLPGCKDACHWADGGENWDCGGDWVGCCRKYAKDKSICGDGEKKEQPPTTPTGACTHGEYDTRCIDNEVEKVHQCTSDGRWEFKYNQDNPGCSQENVGEHLENPLLTPQEDELTPEQIKEESGQAGLVQDCQNFCHTDRGCTSGIGEKSPGPDGKVYECKPVEGGDARWEPIKPPELQPELEKAKLTCRGNRAYLGQEFMDECSPGVCQEGEGCIEPRDDQLLNPAEVVAGVPSVSSVREYNYSCSGNSVVAKISGQRESTVVLNCPYGCDSKTNHCKEPHSTTLTSPPRAKVDKYSCNQQYGRCRADDKGKYSSEASCEAACLPKPAPDPQEVLRKLETEFRAVQILEDHKDPMETSPLHEWAAQTLGNLDSDNDGRPDAYEALAGLDPFHTESKSLDPCEPGSVQAAAGMCGLEPNYNISNAEVAAQRAGLENKNPSQWTEDDIKYFQRQLSYQNDPGRLLTVGIPGAPMGLGAGVAYAELTERGWAIDEAKKFDPDPLTVAYGATKASLYSLTTEQYLFLQDKADEAGKIELPYPDKFPPNIDQVKNYLEVVYPGLTGPPEADFYFPISLTEEEEEERDREIKERLGWDWQTLHNVKAAIAGITEYRQGLQDRPEMQNVKEKDIAFGQQQLFNVAADFAIAGALKGISAVGKWAVKVGPGIIGEAFEPVSKFLFGEPLEETAELTEGQISHFSKRLNTTREKVLEIFERGKEAVLRVGFGGETVVALSGETPVKVATAATQETEEVAQLGFIQGMTQRAKGITQKARGIWDNLFSREGQEIVEKEVVEVIEETKGVPLTQKVKGFIDNFLGREGEKEIIEEVIEEAPKPKVIPVPPRLEAPGGVQIITGRAGQDVGDVMTSKSGQTIGAVIADGHGTSRQAADIATQVVSETYQQLLDQGVPPSSALERAFAEATEATKNLNSGATVVAAVVDETGKVHIRNVGDTTIAVVKNGIVEPIDTSYAKVANKYPEAEAGRIALLNIWNTMGDVDAVAISGGKINPGSKAFTRTLNEGDLVIIGSDGVSDNLAAYGKTLSEIVSQAGNDPEAITQAIIKNAYPQGRMDDLGFSVLQYRGGTLEQVSPSSPFQKILDGLKNIFKVIPGIGFTTPDKIAYAAEEKSVPIHPLLYKRISMIEELDQKIQENPDLPIEEALAVVDKYEYIMPEIKKEGNQVFLKTGEEGTAKAPLTTGSYSISIEPIEKVDIIAPLSVKVSALSGGLLQIGLREGEGKVMLPQEPSLWEEFKRFLGIKVNAQTQQSLPKETGEGKLYLALFHDANGDGIQNEGEENLSWAGVKITLSKTTHDYTYEFLDGWNFVSIPVVSETVKTASDLITDVAAQGGYVTTVARWNNGKWEEYVQRGQERFGQDFPIEPGVAYMLRNHVHMAKWTISGHTLTTSLPLELKTGFNGVAIPYSAKTHTASTILDDINLVKSDTLTPEAENADLISRFVSGNWDVFIKRIFSEENIQEYGNNFPIKKTEGYFIKVKEGVSWTP